MIAINVDLAPGFSINDVVKLLRSKGFLVEAAIAEPQELEPHEEMGLIYTDWFRRYVSDW